MYRLRSCRVVGYEAGEELCKVTSCDLEGCADSFMEGKAIRWRVGTEVSVCPGSMLEAEVRDKLLHNLDLLISFYTLLADY